MDMNRHREQELARRMHYELSYAVSCLCGNGLCQGASDALDRAVELREQILENRKPKAA